MKCTGSLLLLATLLASAVASFGTETLEPAPTDAALSAAIDKVVAQHGISANKPGLAICVRQPGRIQFQKGYGLARLGDREPISPHTTFELASASKSFTATVVLLFHDRGKLSVNDDIRKYIPELPAYPKPIQIRDLLQHVSGLPDYIKFENVPARHQSYWSNEDYTAEFAKLKPAEQLDFPTGEKHEYNNTNYLLLGLILERVAKKSYGQVLRDEVFGPLGMTSSFVYENPQSVPKHPTLGFTNAIAYGRVKRRWMAGWGSPPFRNEKLLTTGDGGIWSNLEDLALWDDAVRKRQFLKPETWRAALTPSKTRDGKTNNYGYGWSLYFDETSQLIGFGHDGSWGGFRSSYYFDVPGDRTTILLGNRANFDMDKFWYKLQEVIDRRLAMKQHVYY